MKTREKKSPMLGNKNISKRVSRSYVDKSYYWLMGFVWVPGHYYENVLLFQGESERKKQSFQLGSNSSSNKDVIHSIKINLISLQK